MQLDKSKLAAPSPRVDTGSFQNTVEFGTTGGQRGLPSSPAPRSPKLGGHRKRPSDASPALGQGLWSQWTGGGASAAAGTLPQYGRRPFYAEQRQPSPPIAALLAVWALLTRPLYLLSRRGPLLPIAAIATVVLLYLTYSTGQSTDAMRRRAMGAVGGYLPRADAIGWRARQVEANKNDRALGALDHLAGGAADAGRGGNDDLGLALAPDGRVLPKGERQAVLRAATDEDAPIIDAGDDAGVFEPEGPRRRHKGGAQPLAPAADDDDDALPGMRRKPMRHSPATLPPPRRDARVVLEEGKRHPIPALMERAKLRWRELNERQSKTFKQAVAEYERRFKRKPPKGFDQWYAFAKMNNVRLIDEFDLIEKNLKMYRAFSPKSFRGRVEHAKKTLDVSWGIRVHNGEVTSEGQLWDHARAFGVIDLTKRFRQHLPNMLIWYNGHDGARIAVAWEERARLEALVDAGEYEQGDQPPYDPQERGPFPHWGYPIFCPPESAVRAPGFDYGWASMESTGLEMPELPTGAVGTVVEDFKRSLDLCESPHYRHFHCTTSWVYQHHPTPLMPLFTPGVQHSMGDIYGLIVEQLDFEQRHDPTWEERVFPALHWRGQTSGPLWDSHGPWRSTQRARLHLLSHTEAGERTVALADEDDNVVTKTIDNFKLNPIFLDTGMVGPAVQCVKEDGTCDEMDRVFQGYDKRVSFDRASLYKYQLDVDGNSWSGRFRRLMSSNAAVVKATVFQEFWTDWCMPWLHFIPIQIDYSDMWDVMGFFRGGVDGKGAHDDLGNEIAQAGKEWVRDYYRYEDFEAYQFRLMLEYARLYNDGDTDFDGDTSIEPEWLSTRAAPQVVVQERAAPPEEVVPPPPAPVDDEELPPLPVDEVFGGAAAEQDAADDGPDEPGAGV